MTNFLKLIFWAILFTCVILVEFKLIEMWYEAQKRQRTFPCTYISGSCTKKPTYKNCKRFGSVPIGVCEMKLNYGDFTNESPKYSLPDDN
tara:strand:+ start:199 stop:468 length:270 start_codon:yes stop_codon:yes gene_type:complete